LSINKMQLQLQHAKYSYHANVRARKTAKDSRQKLLRWGLLP
jgi:hypothetical protein